VAGAARVPSRVMSTSAASTNVSHPSGPHGVRLLHLTDLHLFATPAGTLKGVNTLDTFAAVVALAHRDHPLADACLLTGDLSQDETADSYIRLAEACADLPGRIFSLCGNHDDPDALRDGLFRAAAAVRKPFPAIHTDGSFFARRWQVVLLHSRVAGKVGGKVSDAELLRLEWALSAHPRHFALVCVHHQPMPVGSPWIDAIGLENGAEVLKRMRRHTHARALLFGHVHQELDVFFEGIRHLTSPSTCIQFTPGSQKFTLDAAAPGFRWLNLMDDGRIVTGVTRLAVAPAFTCEAGDPQYRGQAGEGRYEFPP